MKLNRLIAPVEDASLQELAKIKITEFVNKYNQKWLLHRLGLKSPLDYKKIVPSGNTEPEGVRQ